MKIKTIETPVTLEDFGYRELVMLTDLLHAYTNAGSTEYNENAEPKRYANLPSTWAEENVYPMSNPNSGMVFLSNADYQSLVLTDWGVGLWYNTPYKGFEGDLFTLAEKVIDDLTDKDGKVVVTDFWHIDDLNYMYSVLSADTEAFAYTGAHTGLCKKAQDIIIKQFILSNVESVTQSFIDAHEDWKFQLHDSPNGPFFDEESAADPQGWFETELATDFMADVLTGFDDADDVDIETYSEFLRQAMIKAADDLGV